MGGDLCEIPLEQTCINQCSGRGTCYLGFCKCFPGWYGHACHRRSSRHSSNRGVQVGQALPRQSVLCTRYLTLACGEEYCHWNPLGCFSGGVLTSRYPTDQTS